MQINTVGGSQADAGEFEQKRGDLEQLARPLFERAEQRAAEQAGDDRGATEDDLEEVTEVDE